jgi:hypothetical protein
MGDEITDMKIDADAGGAKASSNPRKMPHYVAVMHPLVIGDFRENQTVITAWSYSDLNRLYNYEAGEWGGIRFCKTNMVPSWTGFAQINPVAVAGGALAATNYFLVVTGQDSQNQYESAIYQVSASTAVGANGALQFTTPNVPGFTYSAYIGTTNTPFNLGVSAQGPLQGPLQGQATQLPPNTVVTVTALGAAQVPPAAPATGITVYPTFIFGRGAYAQVVLDNAKFTYLKEADKSDPLNQLRVVGWKNYYGTLISNAQFMMRVESTSAFSTAFG